MKLKPPAETFNFKRQFATLRTPHPVAFGPVRRRASEGIIWAQIRQGVFDLFSLSDSCFNE